MIEENKILSETLFLTKNMSLTDWDKGGMFEREVALYRKLAEQGVKIRFVTYGQSSDLAYEPRLEGIDIICNRWHLPRWFYQFYITHLAPLFWPRGTVSKSNQANGAEIAMQAARYNSGKFVARCGYLYAETTERKYSSSDLRSLVARELEQKIFASADQIIVTTPLMKEKITLDYRLAPSKINVIPNYVEIDRFRPLSFNHDSEQRVCFVGRLEPEKNLSTLLKAFVGLQAELIIVGRGSLESILRAQASDLKLNVRFLGTVPNDQLPGLLNSVTAFILPSLYEGHPKALLEAMSCGLPVIGTNVTGIKEIIRHGENGWLCETDVNQIHQALLVVLANPELQESLGKNARQTIIDHFSLDYIVELELKLLIDLSN